MKINPLIKGSGLLMVALYREQCLRVGPYLEVRSKDVGNCCKNVIGDPRWWSYRQVGSLQRQVAFFFQITV